jgi:hypothetical protein
MTVPEVLINGNHKEIEDWQQQQSLQRTAERRSDLLPDARENKNRTPNRKPDSRSKELRRNWRLRQEGPVIMRNQIVEMSKNPASANSHCSSPSAIPSTSTLEFWKATKNASRSSTASSSLAAVQGPVKCSLSDASFRVKASNEPSRPIPPRSQPSKSNDTLAFAAQTVLPP